MAQQDGVREIGSRRELFIDHYLIDSLKGAALAMHSPVPANVAIQHDKPWEGRYTLYPTVIKDGDLYRLYYRGWPDAQNKGPAFTCYATSHDGITFTRPELGLHEFDGSTRNNIILVGADGDESLVVHNFCPMLDTRPGVPEGQRFKAMGGGHKGGMFALCSGDGIRWSLMSETPVVTHPSLAFDSQNVTFWSEAEGCYVFYYRTWIPKPKGQRNIRWISRRTSADFLNWSELVEMETGDVPPEQFYVNQTHPYFRAPHIYIALAARFWPGRQAITEQQGKDIDTPPKYVQDVSDGVLMTSRGGNHYDRTFQESYIRPGIGYDNWVSRTNYPVLGVVPTSDSQMAVYVSRHYTLASNFMQRCTLRTDGFASVHAPYAGGEMTTRPLTFAGSRLSINYASSAAGGVRVEIQDAAGQPIPGFALADAREIIGDEIDRTVAWTGGDSVAALAGRPVRLRFVMKDADLYAMQFA